MGLTGTIDASVYTGLRDVLSRYPKITTVGFKSDSISKEYIRASIAPDRVEPPLLEVEWRFRRETESYRIHYVDPNTGFNCGWHRDEDHPDLGSIHFQYEHRSTRGIRSDTRRIHEICSDRNSVDCVSSAVRNEDTSIYVDSIVDFREYAGRTPDTSPRRVLFYRGSSQPPHPTVSGVTLIHLARIYTRSVPSEVTGLNSGFSSRTHRPR